MTVFNKLLRHLFSIAKLTKLPSLGEGLGVGFPLPSGGVRGGLLGVVLLLCLCSCSTTRHIPDDDQLFVGLEKIAYASYEHDVHADETKEEIEAALATAPNGALFGSSYHRTLPYALWIWNAAQDTKSKSIRWLGATFGKPPVLMSQVNPALRAQVARQVLRTHGYLHGDVSYKEVTQKNPRKAKIAYTVNMDTLFRVDTLVYVGFPPAMQHLIDSTRTESLLLPQAPFSVQNLEGERTRLSQLFRNNGYYYYQPSYASFLADTIGKASASEGREVGPYDVTLRLQLADSLPEQALKPWTIGSTSVRLRRSRMDRTDSVAGRRFLKVLYSGKRPPIRPGVILQGLKLRPRQLFSYDAYQESMQKVNATGVFSTVDFQFSPPQPPLGGETNPNSTSTYPPQGGTGGASATYPPQGGTGGASATYPPQGGTGGAQGPGGAGALDLLIDCVFDKPYDFYIETNFVNRTIGRLGPELKVGLTRRNAFRGGERLDINLHGSYEWETSSKGSDMNSYQYGADASIEFPRILFPRFRRSNRSGSLSTNTGTTADSLTVNRPRRRRRRFYAPPSTLAKVSTDIVQRPQYYKMHIVSGEWTYRWQPSVSSKHELSPLVLKYQFMNSRTESFDELMMQSPYLTATMDDYFIPKMRYTYTYTSPSTLRNPLRWETTVEESGNMTALYDVLIQGNGWNQKDKTLFKNPYSQFLKVETDLTKTWTLSHRTKLVGHLNYGLMWSYGNSTTGPFSEMFYVGGANSIRAFPVRSIGPGAFVPISDDRQFAYMMQNGDVKLLMNLELRQKLFGNLYGAVFFDAGNVWNSEDWSIDINEEDSDNPDINDFVKAWNEMFSGWKFQAKNLFRQLATGTGIGLRYDLDFLVLRVDWGFGLHLPYDTGKSGYFNIPRFKDMHTLHIAIGYPF